MKQVFLDYIELWLSALGLVLIGGVPYLFAPPGAAWKVAALTAASVGTLHGILFWIVRRRREKTRGLRRLARRVQAAREAERARRLAREVHDALGQALIGLQFDVVWLATQVRAERLQEKLGEMESLVEGLIQSVQGITAELRPSVLDELGAPAALEWLARAFTGRTGLRADFSVEGVAEREGRLARLGQGRATAVFRVAQEALTNASRHAEARRVDVRLAESGGDVVLTVEDDGRGITAAEAEAPDALGILGMRERAAEWGGTLRVEQRSSCSGLEEEEGGTRVTLRLSLGETGNGPEMWKQPANPDYREQGVEKN